MSGHVPEARLVSRLWPGGGTAQREMAGVNVGVNVGVDDKMRRDRGRRRVAQIRVAQCGRLVRRGRAVSAMSVVDESASSAAETARQCWWWW